METRIEDLFTRRRKLFPALVAVLLCVLLAQLLFSVQHLSQTFDESAHLYAGVEHWQAHDFGVNPEHPPLVKLVAALPVMGKIVHPPHAPPIGFLPEEYIGGNALLYGNDADALLFRGRAAVALFTMLLALFVTAAAWQMFGRVAALIALFLFTFEPTLLAHGALVTTDMGVSCWIFAAVYLFWRYLQRPTPWRLLWCSLAAGFALASKMSGLVVLPILACCALVWLLTRNREASSSTANDRDRRKNQAGRPDWSTPIQRRPAVVFLGGLLAIALVSYAILWAFYGFRYAARPAGLSLLPTLPHFVQTLPHPWERSVVLFLAHWHLLPEAYLFGWAKLPIDQLAHPAYLLGRIYPTGTWTYFPVALVIKSSLTLLLLLVALPFLSRRAQPWHRPWQRSALFLAAPALLILLASMTSRLDIGVRHILPMYPFLVVLAAVAAAALIRSSRLGAVAVAALLLFQAFSSLHAYPDYLPYANEAWGGPSRSYRWLSDSNVDWGQQIKEVNGYLTRNGVRDCWMAYSMPGDVPTYYGVPCKPLPTGFAMTTQTPQPAIPSHISGTVLVSATDVSGVDWGVGTDNPYARFRTATPDAMIGDTMLVFHGDYDLPLAAAATHASQTGLLLRMHRNDAAVKEAETAVALAPDSPSMKLVLAGVLLRTGQAAQAQIAMAHAMQNAQAQGPEQAAQTEANIEQLRHPRYAF